MFQNVSFKIIAFFFVSRQLFIQPLRHTISNQSFGANPCCADRVLGFFCSKNCCRRRPHWSQTLVPTMPSSNLSLSLASKEHISTCGGRRQAILEMLCDWKPVAWMGFYRDSKEKTHPCLGNGCMKKKNDFFQELDESLHFAVGCQNPFRSADGIWDGDRMGILFEIPDSILKRILRLIGKNRTRNTSKIQVESHITNLWSQ